MRLNEEPIWGTLLLATGCFILPPLGVLLWSYWRSWRAFKREAEELRAEGYPPPDPPTTDSQVP